MARAASVSHLFPSNWHNREAPVALNRLLCRLSDKKGDFFSVFLVGLVIIIMMMMVHFCANQQIHGCDCKKPSLLTK